MTQDNSHIAGRTLLVAVDDDAAGVKKGVTSSCPDSFFEFEDSVIAVVGAVPAGAAGDACVAS